MLERNSLRFRSTIPEYISYQKLVYFMYFYFPLPFFHFRILGLVSLRRLGGKMLPKWYEMYWGKELLNFSETAPCNMLIQIGIQGAVSLRR
jgi:hypothetical protein